jgi:predicted deacylase
MYFNLNKLPIGNSEIELDIAEDEEPITIYIIKGEVEGPVFGITSTIHGDELNGIEVIKKLFKNVNVLKGILIGIPILNVQGFLEKTRFYDKLDLNRQFNKSPQLKIVKNMKKIIKTFDYLIDLHTATSDNNKDNTVSGGNMNSFHVRADLNDNINENMALLMDPEIILQKTNNEPKGSLRSAAAKLGVSTITVEIGNPLVIQPKYVKRAIIGIENMLRSLKMIPGVVIELSEPVICYESEWIKSTEVGKLFVFPKLASFVEKGSVIALVQSINGDVFYKSPISGIVVGKATDSFAQNGSRIIHIGN